MTRQSLFYKIISAIHIVLFTSMLVFGMIFLTGNLFAMPVLGAAFMLGKDAIYKKLDINDSIVKTYFKYLKRALGLMRFCPINMILLLNIAGMLMAGKADQFIYAVICLALISFLLVFMLYLAGYYAFVDEEVSLMDVMLSMLLKPQYLIPIFAIMVLCTFFASITLGMILFFTGTFFLFALEALVFIQMLYYKKMVRKLDEEDDFFYLINRTEHKNKKEK